MKVQILLSVVVLRGNLSTVLKPMILLYQKGLSAEKKKIYSFRSSKKSFFLPVDSLHITYMYIPLFEQ